MRFRDYFCLIVTTLCSNSYHRHLAGTHRAEMASKLKFLKYVPDCTLGMR